jgi:hypothetical protein
VPPPSMTDKSPIAIDNETLEGSTVDIMMNVNAARILIVYLPLPVVMARETWTRLVLGLGRYFVPVTAQASVGDLESSTGKGWGPWTRLCSGSPCHWKSAPWYRTVSWSLSGTRTCSDLDSETESWSRPALAQPPGWGSRCFY